MLNSLLSPTFLIVAAISALVMVSVMLLVMLGWRAAKRRLLQQRIRKLDDVPADDTQAPRSAQWIETVAKTTENLSRYSGALEEGAVSLLRQKLISAGWRHPSAPLAFFGIKTLLVLACPILLVAGSVLLMQLHDVSVIMIVAVVGAALGLYAPDFILNSAIQKRQRQLLNEFPDALDLMNVCLEAGLSLESALVRVAQEMNASHPMLSPELNQVVLEMRAGRPRDEALRNLARRNDIGAIESFVTTLTQAERFGGSVSDSIRVYSDLLRTQRRQAAEEQAAKIGTKLTMPLVMCILPVLFMVMAGPAFLAVFEAFSKNMGGR
jgi:tight adherence protein C